MCMTITKILCMLLVLVFGSLFFMFADKVAIVRSKIVYNLSDEGDGLSLCDRLS